MRHHVLQQFQELDITACVFKTKISTVLFAVIKYLPVQLLGKEAGLSGL